MFFGDSLTFGFSAELYNRWGENVRWTKLVEGNFKNKNYDFIEFGQGGRTISQDHKTEGQNGYKSFVSAVEMNRPLDIIFIMLGTNNLKQSLRISKDEMLKSFQKYNLVLENTSKEWRCKMPKVILMAPPKINEKQIKNIPSFQGAQEISNSLALSYKDIAKKLKWVLLNAENVKVSEKDGIHLDEEGNIEISKMITNYINKL